MSNKYLYLMLISWFNFFLNFNIKGLTLSVNYVLNIFKNLYNVR